MEQVTRAGVGILVTIVGVVLVSGYLVRCLSWSSAGGLPISARYAVRDLSRHSGRWAAVALMVALVSGGSMLTALVTESLQARADADADSPPMTLTVSLDDGGGVGVDPQGILAAVQRVVGPVTVRVVYRAWDRRAPGTRLTYKSSDGLRAEIQVVDESSLEAMIGPIDAATRGEFRAGTVVATAPGPITSGRMNAALTRPSGAEFQRFSLAVRQVSDHGVAGTANFSTAWMSAGRAESLGLRITPASAIAIARHRITPEQLARLRLYGVIGESSDVDSASLSRLPTATTIASLILSALVVGVAVAMAAAEARDDAATLLALGAGAARLRIMAGIEGFLAGGIGMFLGLLISVPTGFSLRGSEPGSPPFPLAPLLAGLIIPVLAAMSGWIVSPKRSAPFRRGS